MTAQHNAPARAPRRCFGAIAPAAMLAVVLVVTLASTPAAAGPSVEGTVADGHGELLVAMRTFSTAELRSFTPAAVTQVSGLLDEFRGFSVTVRPIGEPEVTGVEQSADRATVWTYEQVVLTYFGLPGQFTDVYITWSLLRTPGGWLVDGIELELDI